MLRPTSDRRKLFCARCEQHVVTDRSHPLFICHDGMHFCSGKDGKQTIEKFSLADATQKEVVW